MTACTSCLSAYRLMRGRHPPKYSPPPLDKGIVGALELEIPREEAPRRRARRGLRHRRTAEANPRCAAETHATQQHNSPMNSRTELGLTLTVEGASNEELMRGLRAAIAVLDDAALLPYTAAAAHFRREGWDVDGLDPGAAPSAGEMRAAELWDTARELAIAACCAGWPAIPDDSSLDLAC
jgi:hypothetical protein